MFLQMFRIAFLCLCGILAVKSNEILDFKVTPRQLSPKIINGEPSKIEKFPFLVSLQYNGTFFNHTVIHFCCGNIIDRFWVVTSAQCLESKDIGYFDIRAGSTNYYKDGEVYKPAEIILHPNFTNAQKGFDIALIKLSAGITFNDRVQAIELPEPGTVIDDDTQLDIAGWGAVLPTEPLSDDLHETQVAKISKKVCETVYGTGSISDEIFCIYRNGYGPCVGDTGSPATVNGTLFGMASWSHSCGYIYPSAYTNVPTMTNWIREVTGINQTKRHSLATRKTLHLGVIATIFTLQSRQYLFS